MSLADKLGDIHTKLDLALDNANDALVAKGGNRASNINDLNLKINSLKTVTSTNDINLLANRTAKTIELTTNEIENYVFYYYTNLENVSFLNGLRKVGDYAFYSCDKISTIPSGIESLGLFAFAYCSNLQNINLSNVSKVPSNCFANCTSLSNVIFSEKLLSIDSEAFSACNSLTNITIPNSVKTISKNPLSYCANLNSINVGSDNNYFCIDEYGVFFDKNKTRLITYPAGKHDMSYAVPNSVTNIDEYAFSESSLVEITSLGRPNTIPKGLFHNCYNLVSITIPESVTYIYDYAFYNCYNLPSITLPNSVTRIYDNAFRYCDNLTTINVPWSEGMVEGAPWGATNATINYNYTGG